MQIKQQITMVFSLILITFSAIESTAQEHGALAGTVIDAHTGDPLPGANILLQGSNLGTTTNLEGHYTIDGIPAGQYQVRISLIGYAVMNRQVQIQVGHTARLNTSLEPSPIHVGEMLIQADRAFSTASSRAVRQFDLEIRPNRSAQQMLQLAPGLIIAQHAGGGKAEQIFLRGFDADHGTDVAIVVDDIPVNMVSHGHGQGYADLHFIIPEIVEEVEVKKGPYFAEFGNLATAGAVAYHTRDHLANNMIALEGGSFNTAQYTMLYQIPLADTGQSAFFAGKYYRTDGPVDSPQGLERLNVFGKFHTHLSERSTLALTVSSFSSAWDASGQIPQRAVNSGRIDRFGAIDDLEGGTTGRQDFHFDFRSQGKGNSTLGIQGYLVNYNFKLFSNFTFFLEEPVLGDGIEQTDDRSLMGLNSRYSFYHNWGPYLSRTTLAGGFRADNAAVSLWKSPSRQRLTSLVEADIIERNLFLWVQEEVSINPQLRLMLGLRGDYFTFNVDDHLDGTPGLLPHASGYTQESILSPKASLVYSPIQSMDLFANFGTGFHSNDARNNVIDARVSELRKVMRRDGATDGEIALALEERNYDPAHINTGVLPRAIGAETGGRARLLDRLNLGVALWWMDLESEFVFVGDAGTTEASGKTRRVGVDIEGRLNLLPWLWADADINLSRGEAVDEPEEANKIPLAPTLTSTGGLTMRHSSGLEGGVRYRHIGDRPANEDDTVRAEGYTVIDLNGTYHRGRYELSFSLENLLDTEWNEAQFDTESRLSDEIDPVSEIHFSPGNPINLRLGLSYLF